VRITRIHVEQALASGAELRLPVNASAHLLRVLRLRPGAMLTVFNGRGGEFAAELIDARDAQALLRIGEHRAIERESPLELTLLQGISRGERMDLIVQKATELGVTRIVPLTADHSVVRLDASQAERRRAHWQAVAIGACEQCGRNRVPEIGAVGTTTAVLAALPATDGATRLLLAPAGDVTLASAARNARAAMLLIGPEGGLSDNEERVALRQGFTACRLGPRVLRTETAPIAALAVLQALAGDLGR
jgi:16S rRNA (uracil1498-N3)-methyltransferase